MPRDRGRYLSQGLAGHLDSPVVFVGTHHHIGVIIGARAAAQHRFLVGDSFGQFRQLRNIHGEHRRPGIGDYLRLSPHDGSPIPHPFEMSLTDRGDGRHLRPEESAQFGDLARAIGTHLGDEDLGAWRKTIIHGTGQAQPIVEAGGAGRQAGGRCTVWSRFCHRNR